MGKTVVTAALAAALSERGVRVRALKPVASGVAPGTAGEDAERLGEAAGHAPLGFARLVAPISPHRAAVREGVTLSAAELLGWIHENLGEITLVEGAGGWEVPLAPNLRVSGLAAALGWPVVVVAADRLGVLNHTLLTVSAVLHAGLLVSSVVLTGTPAPNGADNEADLRAQLAGIPVRRLPWIPVLGRAELARSGRALLAPDCRS